MKVQKKIIALAIAAAFSAPAFAETSIYGLLDGSVANYSGDGQKSQLMAISGGMAQSRIGINSSEDLGTDTRVLVNLEYALDSEQAVGASPANNAGAIGLARQQMLALAGDWGTFATGYLQTEGWKFSGKFDLMGGSLFSPLGNGEKGTGMLMGGVTNAARAQHALAYTSPNLNGVTLGVNYSGAFTNAGGNSPGNVGLASTNTTTLLDNTLAELSANYEQGPLAAGLVYATEKLAANTNAANITEYELGGNYDLTAAKLYAVYHSQSGHVANLSTGASYTNKVYSLAAAVPVGNDTVGFEYAKAKKDETAFGADTGGSGFTLDYVHPMSKMTKLYAAYSKESNGANSSTFSVANDALSNANLTLGGSSTLIAVGVNHKF